MFPLLSLERYQFTVVSYKGHLTRGSGGNALFIMIDGNISVASWVITLVTTPFLDFVLSEFSEIHLRKTQLANLFCL